ncbi:MAG: patatin-like phospholipase family protein [Alcanivorax sp.]|nr:patatin-like phospholipase family protein [Alcanivorax sp.]
MSEVLKQLISLPLFTALPEAALAALAELAEPLSLDIGESLCQAGETPQYLFVLLSGRLSLVSEEGEASLIDPGAIIGARAMLGERPYRHQVHALRDSQLLRFPAGSLSPFLLDYPQVTLALTRYLVSDRPQVRPTGHPARQGTLALVPASPGVPVANLAEALVRRLGGWPRARMVTLAHVEAALGAGCSEPSVDSVAGRALSEHLRQLESCHHHLIYVADRNDGAWAERCLRHGDRVLMLTEAGVEPTPVPVLARLPRPLQAPMELVMLCARGDQSAHTRGWRELLKARSHYYVQPWYGPDLDALARQITGRGLGLVLGGGGARGFAHIGLIRALEQLQMPVDVMGGTSMGAFVSALLACGLNAVEMAQVARDTFVSRNYLNDYTLPRVSLIRGRKFHQRLLSVFGERDIESLWRSYFCVSSNLTSGEAVVHEFGSLATWVGTSMCVPGVAPPVLYEGELLCDGGVVDNLPTDVMQAMERGVIIASSVSAQSDIELAEMKSSLPDPGALLRRERGRRWPGFGEILLRTATLNSDTVVYPASVARSDVCLHMPVTDVGMFDWKALDTLIERGYRHALQVLTPLRDTLIA